MTDTLVRPVTLDADDRIALIDSVRRLLADRCTEADVRRIMDSESGHDPDLWRALAELGVVGLVAPEANGGAGLGAAELEVVMEEVGAALLPAPLISTAIASVLAPEFEGLRTDRGLLQWPLRARMAGLGAAMCGLRAED